MSAFIPSLSNPLYLPQHGPIIGARININDATNIPQPRSVGYEPPTLIGKSVRGKPYYQGLPTLILRWAVMDLDGFQALSTQFFPTLNSEDGPIVQITWPSPYEAGAYVNAMAYMEWPKWGSWEELWLKDVEVRCSAFSLQGQGLFQ